MCNGINVDYYFDSYLCYSLFRILRQEFKFLWESLLMI